MKFIHAADIHLDSALKGLERYEGAPVDEIRSATRRAFDNFTDLAIEEHVDFVLLAGDLYDGDWKDYNTGLYLVERMGRLREAGIRAFMVAGNHDAASQITRHLRLPDNVQTFSVHKPERIVVDELGVAIYGQGFANRAVSEDLSQGYPQGDPQLFNIGLLHTCLDGRAGHEVYAPCTVDGLRSKGYQYWALGHVHTYEEVSRDPWIVFPGNLQGRHIRETGPKGCVLVTVENSEVAEVQFRGLDVLRWALCQVDVTGTDSVNNDVYERVRHAMEEALGTAEERPVAARLVLKGACQPHSRLHAESEYWTQEFRALATGLGGAGLWLEKLALETRRHITEDKILARDDALGGLLRTLQDLELEDAAPEGLAEELIPLRQKLPPAMLSGEDRYDPTDQQQLKTTLEDVKELIIRRLLTTESA
jgi:exonuclease SbcD